MTLPTALLELETDKIRLGPRELSLPSFKYPKGLVFDGPSFFEYLNKAQRTSLWVMTYSYSTYCPVYVPLERLIYQEGPDTAFKHKRIKNHTKLYIQRLACKTVGVYVGSCNLVPPAGNEIMITAPKETWNFFTKYFLEHWEAE